MWNQQVIVETKAGVAGVLAAEYAASSRADGTTLLMAHINSHALAPSLQPKLRYSVERDFMPIVLVGVTPNLLIRREPAAKTVKGHRRPVQGQARPGQLRLGRAGSAQHLALEMFKLQAGVDVMHVPYKGSGPLLTDLMGGQIQYSFETMTAATPHVKGGKVDRDRADACQARQGLPDVPTMRSWATRASRRRPGTAWSARASCRRRSRQGINGMSTPCSPCPTCRTGWTRTAPRTAAARAEKFRQFISTEIVKWAKVVKDGKVSIDS